MPTSTAGTDAARGYTLVELLTVLAIVAAVALVSAPALTRLATPSVPRDSAADMLAKALARQRDDGIRQQRSSYAYLQADTARLIDADGQVLIELPVGTEIRALDEKAPAAIPCVFRPDGSGCRLAVRVTHDGRAWQVIVDPVTGRVRQLSRPG